MKLAAMVLAIRHVKISALRATINARELPERLVISAVIVPPGAITNRAIQNVTVAAMGDAIRTAVKANHRVVVIAVPISRNVKI